MKSFTQHILSEKSVESSKFMKVNPLNRGFYLGVGFSTDPARAFYNNGLRSYTYSKNWIP